MEPAPRTSAPRGFYILNALRVCSVISLVLSIIAAVAVVIESFDDSVNQIDFVLHALTEAGLTVGCIFLIMSECSLAPEHFARNWPAFAEDASLIGQGIAEVCVGILLLGPLNKNSVTQKVMGTPSYGLLISSAVIMMVIGVCTLNASFVFRDKKTTARMARSIRRYRQARMHQLDDAELPEMSVSDPMHLGVSVPERSYSVGSRSFAGQSSGLGGSGSGSGGGIGGNNSGRTPSTSSSSSNALRALPQTKSDCSSLYSVDTEQMAAQYRDNLRLPV